MNADDIADVAVLVLQALWAVFLVFGGYVALAHAGYLKPGQRAQDNAAAQAADASGKKPQRFSHTGAELE